MSNDSCTLVYTLDPKNSLAISFKQFELIIKSLHVFKVNSIDCDPENYRVNGKLDYNANLENVKRKLGGAKSICTVGKANPLLSNDELSEVEKLRSLLGFGAVLEDEEDNSSGKGKKRKYKSGH